MSKVRTHVYYLTFTVVMQARKVSGERGFPIHGAIIGEWGSGKTIASKQVAQELRDVFYLKFRDRNIEPDVFIKDVMLAMGIGPTRGFLQNYNLLLNVLSAKGIAMPTLIIDDAQYLFLKKNLLSFLKDISEEMNFVYVFVGDYSLKKLIGGHALDKRIKLIMEIPAMDKRTIEELIRFHSVSIPISIDEIFEITKELHSNTLELDYALYLMKKAQKQGQNITKEDFRKFLLSAK